MNDVKPPDTAEMSESEAHLSAVAPGSYFRQAASGRSGPAMHLLVP